MSAAPFVVLAAALVTAGIRLGLRRRRSAAGTGTRSGRPRWGPEGDIALVAAREVRERTRGRVFRIGTAIILIAIAAAIVIPVLRRGHHSSAKVGVVGTLSAPVRASVTALGPAVGTTITLKDEPSVDAARRDLEAGAVSVVVLDAKSVLVKTAPGSSRSSTTTLARALASTISLQAGLEASGIPPERAAALAHLRPLPIAGLHPARDSSATAVTVYGSILTFVLLSQYGTWILMGVVEEKSSRVIEVLLASVRPIRLLVGKVLGIGLVALAQAALIIAVALGLGAAVGSDLLRGSSPGHVFESLLWLVVGYVFYCWVYAAAGSLATRMEHVQTIAFPLQLPLLVGYITSVTAVAAGSASGFLRVLAYLPPTAPFAMPALVSLGQATWWQSLFSIALTLAATVLVARVAATVFLRAILRTGQRVRLRQVLGARAG